MSSNNPPNNFVNLPVDVPTIYHQHPIKAKQSTPPFTSWIANLYTNRWIPLPRRIQLMRYFRQMNLDVSWFEQFRPYWQSVLGGATLWSVEDFYFIRNYYRINFSQVSVPDNASPHDHLAAWQKSQVLYQLLHTVYKEACLDGIDGSYWILNSALKKLGRTPTRVFEFGSAIAPLTKLYHTLYPHSTEVQFYISDIQTLAFHYGCYRFQHNPQVIPHLLTPETYFMPTLDEAFDIIFCMTVYEHLNKPLEITQWFYDHLAPNGLLVFDYIKSHASGLDSKQGLEERESVLAFIETHFEIVAGKLDKTASMPLTIGRKR